MFEIPRNLAAGARVLDLGSRAGRFVAEGCPGALIVRLDLETPPDSIEGFVQADAARLPFRDGSFDAVVSNHSLEYMNNLAGVLSEIGRVVRRIAGATGLRLVGTRRFIVTMSYGLRVLDRWFGTRTSVYGWAFYFGKVRQGFETTVWTNVCATAGPVIRQRP